jgi:hypothetical protein
MPATLKRIRESGTSLGRSAILPAKSMAGRDERLIANNARPSWAELAPVELFTAGSDEAHAPHHRPKPPNAAARPQALLSAGRPPSGDPSAR